MGWIGIIVLLFVVGLEFGLEYLFYSNSKKEESEDVYITKTHTPKRRTVTCFALTVAASAASIICALLLKNSLDLGGWIAYLLGCIFAITLPFVLLLLCIGNYEVMTAEGIIVRRIHKKTFVRYDQMAYYSYSHGQLTIYAEDDTLLLFVGDNRIGLQSLIHCLEKRNICKR